MGEVVPSEEEREKDFNKRFLKNKGTRVWEVWEGVHGERKKK